MLEKLGNTLKKSIDKISNAIFVDKKLIEEIVRDLQRELIQADVNVRLLKELSDKIKKEAENDKIKAIEKIATIHPLSQDAAYMGACNSLRVDNFMFNASSLEFMRPTDKYYKDERGDVYEIIKKATTDFHRDGSIANSSQESS
jgi:hypothetical protein